MKLYYSNTSPYSRKVRMVIIEKELDKMIEGVLVNPFIDDPELSKINPLGKIPALVLDNNETLFDSPLVSKYLDSLSTNNQLIPSNNTKWSVLRWEALADGIVDATYNLVVETRRDESEQSPKWIAIWQEDIKRSLAVIEKDINTLGDKVQLSHLAVATAIGYLAFRQPSLFPKENTNIFNWFQDFKQRPAMLQTVPVE